jgi:hypothetical protein
MQLVKELSNFELSLIQIPYSLNIMRKSDVFSNIYTYEERLITSLKNIFFKPNSLKNIFRRVDETLFPDKADILFVHTDMDILNQYIIQKFYKCGAKVYLVEDGIATITQFNMEEKAAEFKDILRCFFLKYIYGFKYLKIIKYGVMTQPVMEDFVFNGVLINYGDTIKRKIPLYKLISTQKQIEIMHVKGAIFFNQPLYLFYMSEKEFIDYIESFLLISCNFFPFYFKFHPSDSDSFKASIVELIKEKFENIVILLEDIIAEEIVYKYPVRYVITISSTSAFNLMSSGVVPIFINNMLNKVYPNDNFNAFGQFLKSINCNSPVEISEIKPGFSAFSSIKEHENRYSIIDIINI